MIELKGKYNTAKVFTDTAEKTAKEQIINLLDHEFIKDSKIRIMPDTHAGAGCTIGTTMTITDKVVPNLVGVDIGCGIETSLLDVDHVDLESLDKAIYRHIPSGFEIRKTQHMFMDDIDLKKLRSKEHINLDRARFSMGTLGGGNHFIEVDKDENGRLYLVIHSGSRYLGKQVAEHYQNIAIKKLTEKNKDVNRLVEELIKAGRKNEINAVIKEQKRQKVDKALAYLEGDMLDDYLIDMAIVQKYALLNRKAMVIDILSALNLKSVDSFTTTHNYIDLESMILRKGAISATEGERVLIPINMRDGSIICVGKGNPDWNFSAPHGAGRLMSRSAAKASITMSQYENSMKGIYSSTINRNTLDEAPFAYKPIEEILENTKETISVLKRITPIYNFKAAEEGAR